MASREHSPDPEELKVARAILAGAITQDAIDAQGPLEKDYSRLIWYPREETLRAIPAKIGGFTYVMDSTDSQVVAYWHPDEPPFVTHNGSERHRVLVMGWIKA